LVDISHLEYGKSYKKVKNGRLMMAFFDENGTTEIPIIKLKTCSAPNSQVRTFSLTANFGDWIYDPDKGAVAMR
jgi:hypothetical protein